VVVIQLLGSLAAYTEKRRDLTKAKHGSRRLRTSRTLLGGLKLSAMRRIAGVLCWIVGVPLILLGLLLALPHMDKVFSGSLPSWPEILAAAVFFSGVGACAGGKKLLER